MVDLRKVINNLPVAVLVVDRDRRVVMANRMAQVFARSDEAGIKGRRGGEVLGCTHAGETAQGCGFSPACRFCDIKNAVLRSFQEGLDIQPFDARIAISGQGPRDLRVTVTHLPKNGLCDDCCAEALVILTIEDMTELKYQERLSAAMMTIGAVCHEMGQPLMACMGYLDMLRMDHPELVRLEKVAQQVERLAALSRRLQSIRSYATSPHDSSGERMLDISLAVSAIGR